MRITQRGFNPLSVFLFTNCFSILAWLFPDFGYLRKGFKEQIDILSFDMLAYLAIMFVFCCFLWIGYNIFSKTGRKDVALSEDGVISDRVYFISIVISFLGLIATYLVIAKTISFGQILSVFSEGKANSLKEALYENYSFGIVSLRYCAILSGSFAIYRRLIKKKRTVLDICAIGILLLAAMISSRLILVAAIFGSLYLLVFDKKVLKLNVLKLTVGILIGFLILSLLNWSRNSNYYELQGMGFFSAGFSEILAYVGTPVQGALFAIGNPTASADLSKFYSLSTIESALTTNSALLDIIRMMGLPGIVFGAMTLFGASLYISIFEKVKNGKYVFFNIPIFYSIAEFWRIFIFFQGLILTLVFASVILFIVAKIKFKSK
nr:O-antigen polymerase [uncultured Erwinia sp.]